MIAISKDEKVAINAKFPDVYIVRTMKRKSKRHHYYCEESKPVMAYLKRLRGEKQTDNKLREGGDHTCRKNTK